MKKVILIVLIRWVVVFGQNSGFDNSVKSSLNSTTTTMTAAGVFTGGSDLVRGYNSVSVTVRSDSSGSYKVLFADAYTMTSTNVVRIDSIAYTGGDTTHTRYFNIVAPYFKVIYTNGVDSQGVFYLTTMFHKGQSSAIDNNGFLKVMTTPGFVISSSGFTSGSYSLATFTDTLSFTKFADYDTSLATGDTVTLTIGELYYYKKGSADSAAFNGSTKIVLTGADTTFTATATRFYVKGDLTGSLIAEAFVKFNFGNQFKTCAVVIRDTTGGSALIDSVKIETYNSTLNVWTTRATGFYDAGTGDILYGDCIVPGNGITKKYFLNDIYPSWIRVTWHSGNDSAKANRKVYLSFEGSN